MGGGGCHTAIAAVFAAESNDLSQHVGGLAGHTGQCLEDRDVILEALLQSLQVPGIFVLGGLQISLQLFSIHLDIMGHPRLGNAQRFTRKTPRQLAEDSLLECLPTFLTKAFFLREHGHLAVQCIGRTKKFAAHSCQTADSQPVPH